MKTRIITLLSLTLLLFQPCMAMAGERDFAAGALIIPMDNFYQAEEDGGILEAYGLVYYLLSHTDGDGDHDIAVYWVINQQKTTIAGADLIIEDLSLTGAEEVVRLYDHAGGTSGLTYRAGDSSQRISYAGGLFIVEAAAASTAKTIINQAGWAAVEVHEVRVPFKAPVYREMSGTPPTIALMNNSEDSAVGSANILEGYLRLAGICKDVYDIVTPNQVRDGVLMTGNDGGPYDLLWLSHWTGYSGYSADSNANGQPDVEDIVLQIKNFVQNGNGMFAQCASIEVLEHSQNGRFLTTKGLGHSAEINDAAEIVFPDVTTANSQIDDFAFDAEGGHLHKWRPFVAGDPYLLDPRPDEAPLGAPEVTAESPSSYLDTVSRFSADDTGWDYHVGGYAYGNRTNGQVAYLGGHHYAFCTSGEPEAMGHGIDFQLTEIVDEYGEFTLVVEYDGGSTSTIGFSLDDHNRTSSGDPLFIDVTQIGETGTNVLNNVLLRNMGASGISVDSITLSWDGGGPSHMVESIRDGTGIIYGGPDVPSGTEVPVTDLVIASTLTSGAGDCTDNDDCAWTNVAGARYVLNALFDITQQPMESTEFVRAGAVVDHPYLYLGSFEWPSYQGHFRRYDVTAASASAAWDTADSGHIQSAGEGNANGRKVYTSEVGGGGDRVRIDFDQTEIEELRGALDLTPSNSDDSDETTFIDTVRNRGLGGIMHSAPVIVSTNSRFSRTDEMAYVGDLYGMLHAIETATGDERWAYIPSNLLGKLKNDRSDPNAVQDFAAVDASPAAGDVFVDHDQDPNTGDPETGKEWRTILVCPQGYGGRYVVALDVTDPDDPLVLWEVTADAILHYTGSGGFSAGDTLIGQSSGASGKVVADDTVAKELTLGEVKGAFRVNETVFRDANANGAFDSGEETITVSEVVEMGHAYRASLNKVRWPLDGGGYETRWLTFVATGHARIAEDHGGITVFAFDLLTGERLWYFSTDYVDSVNDIPGAVTAFDLDADNLVDRVYVGDMDGRMWELDAIDGTNPHGTDAGGKEIPLWNAGVGYPISVSPAVIRNNANHTVVIFGTGGTDWAPEFDPNQGEQPHAVFVVDATELQENPDSDSGAGTLLWKLDLAKGEKVWSAPTVSAQHLYVATAVGELEGRNPSSSSSGSGSLYSLDMGGDLSWQIGTGAVRGSIYVDRQHVYLTTVDNRIKQIGGNDFSAGGANNVVVRDWREF